MILLVGVTCWVTACHETGLDRCSLFTSPAAVTTLNFGGKFRKLSPSWYRVGGGSQYGSVGSPSVVCSDRAPDMWRPTPGRQDSPSLPPTLQSILSPEFSPEQHVRIWRENARSWVECWDIDSWNPALPGGWQVCTGGNSNYMILWSDDDDDDYDLTV